MIKPGSLSTLTLPEKKFKGKQDPSKRKRYLVHYDKLTNVHPASTKVVESQFNLNLDKEEATNLPIVIGTLLDLASFNPRKEHNMLLEEKVKKWLDCIPIYKSSEGTIVSQCFPGTISSRSSGSNTEVTDGEDYGDSIQYLSEKVSRLVIEAYRREIEVTYWNNNNFD